MVYKVEAIIREEKMEEVKDALVEMGVRGITISQVMGCGTQMGYTESIRGQDVLVSMLPKIKVEILVSTEDWAVRTMDCIRKAAWTGNPGDGKIFAYAVSDVLRIRTGEKDMDAVTPAKIEEQDPSKKKKKKRSKKEMS